MSRRISLVLIISVLAAWPAGLKAQRRDPRGVDRATTFMTWNVYHGVDAQIFDVLGATDPVDLALRVSQVYDGYLASHFPERAKAIAAQVAESKPLLIGLQEVIMVRTQTPADGPATPAVDVAIDVAQLILDALEARGLHYNVVVQSVGFDAELPSAYGFDVRHTNRDVILARSDMRSADLDLSYAQTGNFSMNCQVPTAMLGTVTITRAWAAVDAEIRGRQFRFVSTHLEGSCGNFTEAIQGAQIQELLFGPGATPLPLLLVGDLNSPADGSGSTYNALRALGFGDAWNAASVPGAGYTCCQAPDLANPMSILDRRLDFVLYRGDWTASGTRTVGDLPQDRTRADVRLWPSDHAGVTSRLRVPRQP